MFYAYNDNSDKSYSLLYTFLIKLTYDTFQPLAIKYLPQNNKI